MITRMRKSGRLKRSISLCMVVSIIGQRRALAQIAGVKPVLDDQPVLIQPTTVPGYKDCIKNPDATQCVGGNGIRAQAPFDVQTACPTTPMYDETGQLVSDDIIATQVLDSGFLFADLRSWHKGNGQHLTLTSNGVLAAGRVHQCSAREPGRLCMPVRVQLFFVEGRRDDPWQGRSHHEWHCWCH